MEKRFRIILTVEIIIFVVLLTLSMTTITTAVRLLWLSHEHGAADVLRTSAEGIVAANNIQERVASQRHAIYNSINPVIRYISNLREGKQELMTLLFAISPVVAFFLMKRFNLFIGRKYKKARVN